MINMNNKWKLFVSLFQLIVGIIAIVLCVLLISNGERLVKWIITLVLAIAFVAIGIIGIVNYKSNK